MFHYISTFHKEEELPAIPFVNLQFTSVDSFHISVLILYVGSGLVACFATFRALSILSSIKDLRLSSELARYPSIVAIRLICSAFLACALLGSGILLVQSMFGVEVWREYGLYLLFSEPFMVTLQAGGRIYRYKNALKNRSSRLPSASA